MKNLISFFLFFLSATQSYADDTVPTASLFLTPAESREAELLAQKKAPPGQGNIALGAVIYYGAEDWTIWLQGQRWTPDTVHDDLRVEDVSANEVHLVWRDSEDGPERQIQLHPHEIYQIATGKVVTAP